MKNYLRKICSITLLALFASPAYIVIAKAEDRDPFSPSGSSVIKSKSVTISKETEETYDASNPLTSSKLSSYRIVGTITSEKSDIAIVKALSGIDYIVKSGEKFGSEGGRIASITNAGIKVKNKGNNLFLPVSNKIEVNVEE